MIPISQGQRQALRVHDSLRISANDSVEVNERRIVVGGERSSSQLTGLQNCAGRFLLASIQPWNLQFLVWKGRSPIVRE